LLLKVWLTFNEWTAAIPESPSSADGLAGHPKAEQQHLSLCEENNTEKNSVVGFTVYTHDQCCRYSMDRFRKAKLQIRI